MGRQKESVRLLQGMVCNGGCGALQRKVVAALIWMKEKAFTHVSKMKVMYQETSKTIVSMQGISEPHFFQKKSLDKNVLGMLVRNGSLYLYKSMVNPKYGDGEDILAVIFFNEILDLKASPNFSNLIFPQYIL